MQVIGPRPLRRALQAYAALEPMSFQYIDTIHTVVRRQARSPKPKPTLRQPKRPSMLLYCIHAAISPCTFEACTLSAGSLHPIRWPGVCAR